MRYGLLSLLLLLPLLAACGDRPDGTPSSSIEGDLEVAGVGKPAAGLLARLRSEEADDSAAAVADLAAWYEEAAAGVMEEEAARDALLPSVDDLARIAVEHADADARWNAVLLLGEMGRRALSATDALVHATREADPALRKMALEGLAEVASPRLGLLSGLRDVVLKALPEAKREILARWNPPDPEAAYGDLYVQARDRALAAVLKALTHEKSLEVKRSALHHLGSWGPGAAHLTKIVVPYLRHEDRDMRQNAVYTLRALKPPADLVVQRYMEFIRREDRSTVRGRVMIAGAILGLGELGPDGAEALSFLERLAEDSRLEEQVRAAIVRIEAGLSVVGDEPPRRVPDPMRNDDGGGR